MPKGHQQHRQDSLLLGAARRIEGLDVRPAEDARAMEAANPVKDGQIKLDDAATERREDAMVEKILASGSLVLLLGGAHDLTNNVPDDVEIVRVTVQGYAKLMEESSDFPLNRTLGQDKN